MDKDETGYDFKSEENSRKWQGLFLGALKQIQKQVHPTLVSKDDGLLYVESLILRLLNSIINSQNKAVGNTSTAVTFHQHADVEAQIKRLFPQPLDRWSMKRAHEILAQLKHHKRSHRALAVTGAFSSGGSSSSSSFSSDRSPPLKTPVDKFHQLLQKELLHHKTDISVSQYILAVLEYIAKDILQLSGHYVRNMTHTEITSQDIRVAMCADKVLMDLFYSDLDEVALGPPPSAGWASGPSGGGGGSVGSGDGGGGNSGGGVYGNSGGGQAFRFDAEALEFGGAGEYGNIGARPTYLDAVKELIREERQFGRDLNLIIKVFRDPLVGVLTPAEIERFFGNIDEVLEFSTDFLFSLEDAIELADEEDCPIGACFEDIAEEQAFDVFEKYAAMIMPLALRDELYFIFKREDVAGPLTQRLGEQMMAAMRYVLPQLLLVPIHHCVNSYFKAVANLKELTTSKEDRDSFEQAEALMLPLRSQLAKLAASNKKMGEAYFLRLNGRTNRATALAKMTDIQRAIDGWEGKDIGQSCNEFIMEGPLSKEAGQGGIGHRGSAHRLTERHGFLFDGLLVLCKPNISKRGTAMSVTAAVTGRDPPSSAYDWRLKERFLIRNIEIADRGGDEYREERKRERERKEEEERLKKEKKMEMGEEMGEEMEEKEQQQQEKDPETGNSSFYVPATPATPSSSSAAFSASSSTLNTLVSEHSPLVPETSAPTSSTAENSSSSANPNGNNGKDNQNPNSSSSTTAASNSTTTTPLSDFIHAFEIKSRPNLQSSGIVLVTKTPEEKDRWMSQLILLNTRSMLERTLDSRLQEEAKKHPLQLPHPSHYRFATEDFDTNIIFEETRSSMLSSSSSSNVPLIKGATLLKLIERLTYHKYGDPALVRTFLTTYRSFCTPTELLKLLIERFEIPNPDLSSCLQAMHFANQELASPTSIHPSMGGLNHQQNHLQHQQNHHQHHQNHQSEAIVGSPVTASAEETTGGVQENSTTTVQGPPTSPISPTTSIMSDFSSNTFTFLTGAEEGGNTPADTEQQQRDYTEMVKKFRKEYAEPVQFRVMNVLRHWIENHYYDFERDPSLLEALTEFLERKKRPQPSTASASASASSAPNGPATTTTTTSSSSLNLESMSIVGGSMISLLLKSGPESVQAVPRTMRKLIEHLTKVIDRKKDQASKQKETSREIMHNSVAPAIEWWLTREEEEFDLLTLHPVEIARQLTLLEFELYCAVKPSELVGTEQGKTGVWTKKDKQKTSPNLLKLIYHNSNFTYYLEKCIIEAENFEERVAILLRIIEIMIVLQELNNFNGVIEVMSALHSASVFRLEHTMARIESNSKLKRAFDEGLELMQDHFKKYQDKLRSINPPCVPFFGTYLTNILHLEEGNPEYLSPPQHLENMSLHDTSGILSDEAVNCKLINFSKKRKVAEITGEIQQYQNQPYCLKVEPTIRHFLENLAPHTGMTEREFDDYLYTRSMIIEPRGAKQPVKNPRKWPSRQLKSPGIKTVKQRFIPLMSIDPLISNFTSYAHNHGSSSHHHQNSGQQNSTPNSANSQHHLDLDSLSQQISPPTPLTPPHSATSFHHHSHSHSHQSHHSHHRHNHHHHSRHNSNNDTIFANVIIGGGGGGQRDGPSASPTTPVHHSSTTSNCFNFPVSGQSPAGQLADGSFLPTPPPLPPRTNRGGMNSSVLLQQQQQSPRTRFPPFPPPSALAYSEGGNNEGFSSPISTNSNSPPPLPPRSHLSGGGGGGGTLSRSTSLAQAVHSLREPPPVPSQPHPTSSSSHHGTPPPPPLPPFGGALPLPPPSSLPPFVQHQRVSSDITSLSSSSTNGGIPTTVGGPILRRNSTLEPIPSSKRYSHGNPPPPLPSMQGGATSFTSGPSSSSSPSPLHTPLLTPPSASSLTPLPHPPPPHHSSLQSPSSSSTLAMSPGGGGGGGGSLGGVPELPPKTYRLSSACRLTEEVLAKTTYPSSTMTNK